MTESSVAQIVREAPEAAAHPRRPAVLVVAAPGELGGVIGVLAAEFEVSVAHSQGDLLSLAEAGEFDAVVVNPVGDAGCADLVGDLRRARPTGTQVPILAMAHGSEEAVQALEAGADDVVMSPFPVAEVPVRLRVLLARATAPVVPDASVLDALRDAVVVSDAEGRVLHVNEAFTRLLGWRAEDALRPPPYPWWPDDQRYGPRGEFRLLHKDGRGVWVWLTTSTVALPGTPGVPAWATVLRDVTGDHEARARRAAAAGLAGRFAQAQDLTAVLITALAGFTELFDGDSVVDVSVGGQHSFFTATGPADDLALLPEELRRIPDDQPAHGEALDGLLVKPQASDICRAWVRFPSPRVLTDDEVIVGNLLAESFALAVERVTIAAQVDNLHRAVESHRMIGQATGILIERHHLTPRTAFERLSKRSQDTNTRVRDLAARLIETGEEA